MPTPRRRTPPLPPYSLPPEFNEPEPEPEPDPGLKKGERCTKKQDNCAKGLVCTKKKWDPRKPTCQPIRSSKKKRGIRSTSSTISMRVKDRKSLEKQRRNAIGLEGNSPDNESVNGTVMKGPVKNPWASPRAPSYKGEYIPVDAEERQQGPGEYMYVNTDTEEPDRVHLLDTKNNVAPVENRNQIFLHNNTLGRLGGPLGSEQAQSPQTGQKKRRAKKSYVNKKQEKKGPTKKERKYKASRKKKGN